MNRLIYYPTGSYGTFVQWLCNTASISSAADLPFHEDGNSHQYVLSDQYRLLVSSDCSQEFVNTQHSNVASCIWPLDHNGKKYNEHGHEDFYFQFRPSGLYRTFSQKPEKYKLGNTMAAMFAENPEIEKLISQLPGYRPGEKYSQFDINTENMRDLLPKIKDILVKASQSGLHNYSFAQDSTPRSVVPQEIQRR